MHILGMVNAFKCIQFFFVTTGAEAYFKIDLNKIIKEERGCLLFPLKLFILTLLSQLRILQQSLLHLQIPPLPLPAGLPSAIHFTET